MIHDMNNVYPAQTLDACVYSELPMHSKVFSYDALEYFLYVKIPNAISAACEFIQLDEVSPNPKQIDNLYSYVVREENKPWIRIVFKFLDISVGYHLYRFQFVNRYTNDVISLYISYTIQNTHVERPYIYMDTN